MNVRILRAIAAGAALSMALTFAGSVMAHGGDMGPGMMRGYGNEAPQYGGGARGGPYPGMTEGYGRWMGPGMMDGYGGWMGPGMMGGYGGWMGPGMMGGYGGWMGPGMMGGYGGGMGSGMMGGYGGWMGPGMMGGYGWSGGPGFAGGGMANWLGLNDDQRKQLDEARQSFVEQRRQLIPRLQEKAGSLYRLMLDDKADSKAIGQAYDDMAAVRKALFMQHVELHRKLASLLTSEQREQLEDMGGFGAD